MSSYSFSSSFDPSNQLAHALNKVYHAKRIKYKVKRKHFTMNYTNYNQDRDEEALPPKPFFFSPLPFCFPSPFSLSLLTSHFPPSHIALSLSLSSKSVNDIPWVPSIFSKRKPNNPYVTLKCIKFVIPKGSCTKMLCCQGYSSVCKGQSYLILSLGAWCVSNPNAWQFYFF